jgi:hypothetical protein
MTMRHLEDDVLLDVTFGAASVEATRHAAECAECARRTADARAGLAMAAGAEVPEPSPLFWDAFRSRVASAIDAPPAWRTRRGFLLPAFLATAATVATIALLPRSATVPATAPASLPAWSALAEPEEVPADELVAGCLDVAECVADLSDEEGRAFADALEAELGKSGDL